MTATAVAGTRRSMKELVDGTIRVQIDIDPPDRAAFLRLFPNIDMPVALAPLALNTQPAPSEQSVDSENIAGSTERAPNELARKLHVSGYFRNPRLWLAMHDSGVYTAQEHFKWLMANRQCHVAGVACQGDLVVHHCNSAAAIDGGKRQPEAPQKPLHFWGLVLCFVHHQWVHTSTGATREQKEHLLEHAVGITADRVKVRMKRELGIDSLAEITEDMLAQFEKLVGR